MKNVTWVVLLSLGLASCSSKKNEKTDPPLQVVDNSGTIKLDYEVRDASSQKRPTWVESATQWAEENNKEVEKYRYFSFMTEPKVNREAACSLAKANAKADIAGEITTFISKSLGFSREGQASIDENNPRPAGLREFVEDTLAEKIVSLINGAAVVQTYWEKRQYLQSKGAKSDFVGFTCAALVRIESERLKAAVNEASQKVVAQVADPETKENVKKALDKADDEFVKARQGQL